PGVGVPNPHLPRLEPLAGRAGDLLAVRGKDHAAHAPAGYPDGPRLAPTLRIPEAYRLVLRGGRQTLAVGAEDDVVHLGGVPSEGEDFLPGRRVPNLQRSPVPRPTGGGQALAVGAKRDAAGPFDLPREPENFLPRLRVPQPHRIVRAG